MNKFRHLEEWFQLPDETKIRLFTETSRKMGLPSSSSAVNDWWVVPSLAIIFSMNYANALIFKGGTSLSKGWKIINRFSEDIDLALDREFIGVFFTYCISNRIFGEAKLGGFKLLFQCVPV
ncbi:MAG: nucleotidyl transferase AbiEii/AbiGii toxin family protein [Sphingobacteriales bacterium]|jgi:hypothetical protein|nr:nucleotidyl transferase AbiEii/AbiGii toxin family protein [Sphingobacteriales bacterium]